MSTDRAEKWMPVLFVFLTETVVLCLQNDLCRYDIPAVGVIAMAAAAALFVRIFLRVKGQVTVCLLILLAVFLLVTQRAGRIRELATDLGAFFRWYFAGKGTDFFWFYVLSLVISTFYVMAAGMLCFRLPVLWRVAAAGLLLFLIFCFWQGLSLSGVTAAFCFLFLFVTGIDMVQNHRILFSLFPVIALSGLLLVLVPKPEEAYSWQFVKDAVEAAREGIRSIADRISFYAERGEKDVFSLQFSGYSENDGQVGGDVTGQTGTVLTVTFRSSPRTNLYLIGSVWDTFEDNTWSAEEKDVPENPDYLAEIIAELSEEEQESLFRTIGLSVTYEDIYTETLFMPEQATDLYLSSDSYSVEESRFRLKKPEGSGYSYRVTVREFNAGSEAFDDFLKEYAGGEKADDAYTDYVYETYLTEPDVSDEAAEFIRQITEGEEDIVGKLSAVESVLQTFSYTTHPAMCGEDENFLDFFLLESREGYCTYFATAFTLIARYLGVPARYVSGYVADCADTTAGSTVEVTKKEAHAWPEVWLDGIGWVAFEPTPSYGEVRYVPWTMAKEQTSAAGIEESAEEKETEEEPVEEVEETEGAGGRISVILLFALSCLIFSAAVFALIFEIRIRRRHRRESPEQTFDRMVRICFLILEEDGMPRMAWETVSACIGRLSEKEEEKNLLASFPVDAHEAFCYGGVKPDGEDLRLVRKTEEALKEAAFEKRGRIKRIALAAKIHLL